MKKKILLSLPALFLCLLSALIFLVGIYGRGWNRTYLAIVFIGIIPLHFLYYYWLATTKRIGTKLTVFYIPANLALFVFSIALVFFVITHPPGIKRVKFNMGPDPFSPRTTITHNKKFAIWQKEFWLRSAREEYRVNRLVYMQKIRQGSLIGHIGTSLQGWSEEKIKTAFGEPAKIVHVDDGLEKWVYHPWTNHPEWEMPVYVQNKHLLRIGD